MTNRVAKLTISLPYDLLAMTDAIAAEKRISRSKLINLCLQELAEKRLHMKMAEGYQALAEDNLRFADQAVKLAHEVLAD